MTVSVSAVTGKVVEGSHCCPLVGTNFVIVWKYRGTLGKMLRWQSRGQDLISGDEAGVLNTDLWCSVYHVYLIHCRTGVVRDATFVIR